MNSKDFRRLNTILLAKEVGSITALAALIGTSQSYLSQIVGAGAKRDMGDDLARRLEYTCGKPHGWLDVPHIDETKLTKAREIYENLLRLDEKQLDALITVLGFNSIDMVRIGQTNINNLSSISAGKRKTNLGSDTLGKDNKAQTHRAKKSG